MAAIAKAYCSAPLPRISIYTKSPGTAQACLILRSHLYQARIESVVTLFSLPLSSKTTSESAGRLKRHALRCIPLPASSTTRVCRKDQASEPCTPRCPTLCLFIDSAIIMSGIASDIQSVPQTFSSWDSCMSKVYCK